jgi:hypothetical protein
MATTSIEPKPSYLSDDSLRPFIQPTFDPADFLNSVLPPLHLASHSAVSRQANALSLADLSSQTQSLLSQLNAHAARLTNVLTQLTDEILRSGGRLAYEVDVLRGETINLSESLNDTLNPDIKLFLPAGLSTTTVNAAKPEEPESQADHPSADHAAEDPPEAEKSSAPTPEPPYLTHLRTLTTVRNRLNTVIKLFNDAMQWPPPTPSDSLLPSTLLSVSAPNTNDAVDRQARDAKAREFAENLRREIVTLVEGHPDGARAGYEAAMERVMAMRELVGIWRGTGEERARARFVDSLEKVAVERLRDIEGGVRGGVVTATPALSLASGERAGTPSRLVEKGVGFLDNLSRMRNG